MCFSASASFGTSVLLGLAGFAITAQKAKHRFYFASIPFLFALQQAAEGIVWLGLAHQKMIYLQKPAMYLFLFFAFAVWPLLVPGLFFYLENTIRKKKLLLIPLICGIAIGLSLMIYLMTNSITVTISGNHIEYHLPSGDILSTLASIFYLIATITPFFITSFPRMKLFGALLIISYIISYLFFYYTHVSVWCFFAALLSLLLVIIVRK